MIIAVLAVLWIGSGAMFSSDDLQASGGMMAYKPEKKIAQVRVRDIKAESFVRDIAMTGRTQAAQRVTLKAEISGSIKEILVREGERVEAGQVLARLDIGERQARVEETKERVKQRGIEYNAAKSLENKGFNSKVRLAQTLADLEEARADLAAAEKNLANTVIRAPFSGVINRRYVEIGDYASVGQDLYDLVNLNPLEMQGFVTEHQVGYVQAGRMVSAVLLNDDIIEGIVTYVAPAADPQTRTFAVKVQVPNDDYILRDGITAEIHIPAEEQMAHKISPSVLTLDDDGMIGVKVIEDGNRVRFAPVEILSDRPDYMWVGGLPNEVTLITVGQEFVVPEQIVEAVPADGDGLL